MSETKKVNRTIVKTEPIEVVENLFSGVNTEDKQAMYVEAVAFASNVEMTVEEDATYEELKRTIANNKVSFGENVVSYSKALQMEDGEAKDSKIIKICGKLVTKAAVVEKLEEIVAAHPENPKNKVKAEAAPEEEAPKKGRKKKTVDEEAVVTE